MRSLRAGVLFVALSLEWVHAETPEPVPSVADLTVTNMPLTACARSVGNVFPSFQFGVESVCWSRETAHARRISLHLRSSSGAEMLAAIAAEDPDYVVSDYGGIPVLRRRRSETEPGNPAYALVPPTSRPHVTAGEGLVGVLRSPPFARLRSPDYIELLVNMDFDSQPDFRCEIVPRIVTELPPRFDFRTEGQRTWEVIASLAKQAQCSWTLRGAGYRLPVHVNFNAQHCRWVLPYQVTPDALDRARQASGEPLTVQLPAGDLLGDAISAIVNAVPGLRVGILLGREGRKKPQSPDALPLRPLWDIAPGPRAGMQSPFCPLPAETYHRVPAVEAMERICSARKDLSVERQDTGCIRVVQRPQGNSDQWLPDQPVPYFEAPDVPLRDAVLQLLALFSPTYPPKYPVTVLFGRHYTQLVDIAVRDKTMADALDQLCLATGLSWTFRGGMPGEESVLAFW